MIVRCLMTGAEILAKVQQQVAAHGGADARFIVGQPVVNGEAGIWVDFARSELPDEEDADSSQTAREAWLAVYRDELARLTKSGTYEPADIDSEAAATADRAAAYFERRFGVKP